MIFARVRASRGTGNITGTTSQQQHHRITDSIRKPVETGRGSPPDRKQYDQRNAHRAA